LSFWRQSVEECKDDCQEESRVWFGMLYCSIVWIVRISRQSKNLGNLAEN
jgi:hypothetical protein